MTPEELGNQYSKRIAAVLIAVRDACIVAGQECDEVWEADDEEQRWSFTIHGKTGSIDITFTICESEVRDGSENGVNFMLDAVDHDGRIVVEIIPANFTDRVWVSRNDPMSVEERFKELEEAGADRFQAELFRQNQF